MGIQPGGLVTMACNNDNNNNPVTRLEPGIGPYLGQLECRVRRVGWHLPEPQLGHQHTCDPHAGFHILDLQVLLGVLLVYFPNGPCITERGTMRVGMPLYAVHVGM